MSEPRSSAGKEDKPPSRSGPRKLAEWVSLGISALIIAALAGYLLIAALRAKDPLVLIEVTPQFDQTRAAGSQTVLPVLVQNRSDHTVRDLQIELHAPDQEAVTVTLDYLAGQSEERLFFHLAKPPESAPVSVRPGSYRRD